MNGPSRPDPSIETRLDDLLDRLNSGDDLPTSDDPELQELTTLARAIGDDDQLKWPDASYPDRLTASVYAELRPDNDRATPDSSQLVESWNEQADYPTNTQINSIPASDVAELTADSDRSTRLRRFAQIAAAVVGFGLVTLVLVAVFRGFDDEQPAAIGAGDDHPPQIAVTMQTDPVNGNPDIFLVSLDGSDPVNLTANSANDTMPAWSPDGSKIAFISDRGGADALYVMEADGSFPREIYAPDPAEGWHLRNVSWSPDGLIIAVMRYPANFDATGAAVLWIAAGGGNRLRVITMSANFPQLTFNQTPVWSPDSTWVMFEVQNDEETHLAVSGREAGYLPLPLPGSASSTSASWSANNEIAIAHEDGVDFVEFVGNPPSELVSDETTNLPISTTDPVTNVEWSPNRSQLALTLGSTSGSSIWITSSDGDDLIEVPESFSGLYPAWSPDGAELAFLRFGAFFSAKSTGHDLVVYDVENSMLTTVVDTGFSGPLMSPPVWRPDSASAVIQVSPVETGASEEIQNDPFVQTAIDQVRASPDDPTAKFTAVDNW